jgi:hypothetical protein
MLRLATAAIATVFLLAASLTTATAMTCKEFTDALPAAIAEGGDQVAVPKVEKVLTFPNDVIRYEFRGIVGLSDVSLRCGKADQFGAFTATLKIAESRSDEDLDRRIWRIENLAAAAICVVTNPRPRLPECLRVSKDLAVTAAEGFMKQFNRGEPSPSGSKSARLNGGFEAYFGAYLGLLNFVLTGWPIVD